MASKRLLPLAVLESRWGTYDNISFKGIMDVVSELQTETPHSYHYEMFGSGAAFKESFERLAATRGLRYLYVASHGWEEGIQAHNEDIISSKTIKAMLKRIEQTPGAKLSGLYFGTCYFGRQEMAEYIFKKKANEEDIVTLKWIAGYAEPVDWIPSTVLDMYFWNCVFDACKTETSEGAIIANVAEKINTNMAGLAKELKFQIFVRKPKCKNQVIGLINYPGDPIAPVAEPTFIKARKK